MTPETVGVYPVIDLAHLGTDTVAETARRIGAVLRSGATIVQLREKQDRFAAMADLVATVRPWLQQAGVPLIINDRLDLALAFGASGVHLGQHDMPVAEARNIAAAHGRPDLWLGVSVASHEQASRAIAQGASYVSASPVFGTPTKTDIDPPLGLEGLRRLRRAVPNVPLVAIGGIKPANAAEVLAAGADGLAFISPLSVDPESTTRALAEIVRDVRSHLGHASRRPREPQRQDHDS
jgi:thiamine-phosphate pyrophosphorylase